MNEALESVLIQAISAYDYPSTTYDFLEKHERRFSSVVDLEHFLKNLLLSHDMQSLKDGLSGILFWGYYRVPYRDHRVGTFRAKVSDAHLQAASGVFPTLEGNGLMRLSRLALPEFSNMAFVTKLRTFLDPDHYCVLDRKIARLAQLASRLKFQPTYIPINAQNERVYGWWVDACRTLASRLPMKARPIDVERGIFHLADHGEADLAERLLNEVVRCGGNDT
jgi:hypothetical protein